ncbi:large ribosomal subunit protein uL2-like isoform X2 [Tachypleus tridentatus]|uniref:large ribosomal subunit protein uL2-like isoform X2 n=1 Tax=Tachypleus tridentatus TaxID=6853 RepID=UPI003FCFCCE6
MARTLNNSTTGLERPTSGIISERGKIDKPILKAGHAYHKCKAKNSPGLKFAVDIE